MNYIPPIYRPPSEANSLILQVTYGCSYNQCGFCAMYKDKPFALRSLHDIEADIASLRLSKVTPHRIFLADGDALILPFDRLSSILQSLKSNFSTCTRISAYATARSLLLKTPDELFALKALGLDLLYLGIESGSDTVLMAVNKGCSADEMLLAAKKAKAAGFSLSTMLISGLGGLAHWQTHATQSAGIINAIEPDYVSLLTLMLEPGTALHQSALNGTFKVLSPLESLEETLMFLRHLQVKRGVFRANHASNYLNLSGNLPEDLIPLIEKLELFLQHGGQVKPDYLRGL